MSLADPAGDQCRMTVFKAEVSMTGKREVVDTNALGCFIFPHTVFRIQG